MTVEANEFGKYCKPCKEGYEQDAETCECTVSDWVAALCKDEVDMDSSCQCQADEPYEAKCFYGYRLSDDCQCQAPPECDLECEKGQKLNKWDCACEDKPVCEPCGESGMKQHPWTCECRSYLSMDLKCRFGDLDAESCMCSAEKDGEVKEFEPKCKRGYEMDDSCSTCNLSEEHLCKPVKCGLGQGWSTEDCMCVSLPECASDEVECDEGMRYDKVSCECVEGKKKGGKKGGKGEESEEGELKESADGAKEGAKGDKKGGKGGKGKKGGK